MTRTLLPCLVLVLSAVGCSNSPGITHGGAGTGPITQPSGGGGNGGTGVGGVGSGGNGGGGSGGSGMMSCTVSNPNVDMDGDGYTPAAGDCNDCDPLINPGAVNIPGDPISYDCSGNSNAPPACDGSNTGKNDPTSLSQSIELCDTRFLKSATMNGPSDARARNVKATFGVLKPQKGANMMLLSNGIAVDESGSGYVNPQQGTNLGNNNTFANPLPNLQGASNCGQAGSVPTVNDYTELVLQLKAPTNAQSFSFQFQFFSGEYPDYVCTEFNDEFLAIVKSDSTYPSDTNISFDANKNPITVNSGFFIVCDNGGTPQTSHCTQPPSNNQGTGYETSALGLVPGGSTGWLTTTAPIKGGENLTLRFVIFDESDHILDSAVLIDNFQWAAKATMGGPVTVPISKLIRHHHRATPAPAPMSALMCS
jgi:hypothetical protein